MTDENFEEKFPSLKYTENKYNINGANYIYWEDINRWCLDKQKVKEAIIKYCPGMTLDHACDCKCVGCNLLKELGL